ncbi:MAG TPA: GDP-L-fucose synthase [Candidatus Ozemobacteraceae bacterium]|nr:GDP-L-fucose synthase [Candidatus Ozemobacteraceae bacterium]
MEKQAKIYVAGHRGLAGGSLTRALKKRGYDNLLLKSHTDLELRDGAAVEAFFSREKPEYVLLAAAKVGGIHANATYPAEFIYDNLAISTNVIHAAWRHGVKRLLFLGSSCIYPRECPQPMREEHLLGGPLEPTNAPYALAKIAGVMMCDAYNRQYGTKFLSVMPTNLYGPGDNYDLRNSHVLPALIRKFHEAKTAGAPTAEVWGTGTPRREFLYSDDMADACLFLLEQPDDRLFVPGRVALFNIGCGADLTIRELAETVASVVGFTGKLVWDASKPDGTPRKLLDMSRLFGMGWRPRTNFVDGIRLAYDEYLAREATQKRNGWS